MTTGGMEQDARQKCLPRISAEQHCRQMMDIEEDLQMLIQLNTDSNIKGDDVLAQQVEAIVKNALERFSEQVTRVEVHISDENSENKFGTDDKRCLLEARLAGLQPISVSHQAATVAQAVDGAVEKMKRSLDSTLGRLGER